MNCCDALWITRNEREIRCCRRRGQRQICWCDVIYRRAVMTRCGYIGNVCRGADSAQGWRNYWRRRGSGRFAARRQRIDERRRRRGSSPWDRARIQSRPAGVPVGFFRRVGGWPLRMRVVGAIWPFDDGRSLEEYLPGARL